MIARSSCLLALLRLLQKSAYYGKKVMLSAWRKNAKARSPCRHLRPDPKAYCAQVRCCRLLMADWTRSLILDSYCCLDCPLCGEHSLLSSSWSALCLMHRFLQAHVSLVAFAGSHNSWLPKQSVTCCHIAKARIGSRHAQSETVCWHVKTPLNCTALHLEARHCTDPAVPPDS